MISNLSQIIPMPLSSRELTSHPVSGATIKAVADPIQISAAVDKASVAQAVANNGEQVIGADKALTVAVDHLNANIQNLNRNLEFSIDKESGNLIVKIIDAQTHEVIRQIPREEVLVLARSIDQYLQDHHVGLLQAKA